MNIKGWGHRWLDSVFPGRCHLCGDKTHHDELICFACKLDLPWLGHTCQRCAVPMTDPAQQRCGECQSQPPFYDRVYSLFSYRRPVSELIVGLKFQQRLPLARLLGRLMLEHLLALQESSPDTIIPVPLHPRRLRERGFNQAHELARPISKGLSIEICPTGIERFHERPPQITLSRKQRLKNTRGAFRVHHNFLKGHVLIIDDVMTTGATVNELARILKLEGVERVDILTLARAGDNAEFVDIP